MPRMRQAAPISAAVLLLLALFALPLRASVSLLVEEPFGTFGDFNPTGHAAIYLSNVCAETPTRLRPCHNGELGVVISRYHRVHGYDWLAMPLLPYLYAVDRLSEVPAVATPALETELRDRYRREHLRDIAPDGPDGSMPRGEWIQLVGAAYDRRIYGFSLDTTPDQDAALIAQMNDSRNHSHFNLLYRNCADFARAILRHTYPGSISRNSMADFWLTTPKHLARTLSAFGGKHPEFHYATFQIPQVPGTIRRSHSVDGISESLVRSKKYLVPIVVASPVTAVSLAAAYIGAGRYRMPKDAATLDLLERVAPEPWSSSTIFVALEEAVSAEDAACRELPPSVPLDMASASGAE